MTCKLCKGTKKIYDRITKSMDVCPCQKERSKKKSEYALASDNQHLLGKRARILEPVNYCSFLWHATGVIQEVYGNLFLKFDTPQERMPGVYLYPNVFTIEEVTQ